MPPDTRFIPVPDAVSLTPAPRPTRLSRYGLFRLLGIACAVLLVASLLIWWFVGRHQHMQALAAHGIYVTAKVTGKTTVHGKSTSYNIYFDYIVGGYDYNSSESVSQGTYVDTNYGDPEYLTYLPSDPTQYELGSVSSSRVSDDFDDTLLIASLLFLLPGIGLCWVVILTRRESRFVSSCTTTDGSLIDLSTKVVSTGRSTAVQYWAEAAYQVAGVRYTRRALATNRFFSEHGMGDAVAVLYDPAKPADAHMAFELPAICVPDTGGSAISAPHPVSQEVWR